MKVYVHGNCQSILLRGLLCEVKPDWRIINRQVHVDDEFADHELYLSDLATADIVIAQPISDDYGPEGSRSLSFIRAHISPDAALVTFPSLFFRAQFPEWYYLHHGDGLQQSVGMSYHNVHVLNAVLRGEAFDDMARRLLSPGLYSKEFVEAQFNASIASLEERETALSIDIRASDILAEQCREREIMNTINHPRRNVAYLIANRILQRLGYAPGIREAGREYLPLPRIPMSNSVARHLLPPSYEHNTCVELDGRVIAYRDYLAESYKFYRKLAPAVRGALFVNTPDAGRFLNAYQTDRRSPLKLSGAALARNANMSASRRALHEALAALQRRTGIGGFTPGDAELATAEAKAFVHFGTLLQEAGQPREAAAALRVALEAAPDDPECQRQLRHALMEAGGIEGSIFSRKGRAALWTQVRSTGTTAMKVVRRAIQGLKKA